MDRSLGQRMGVLSPLRQCQNVAIPEQQPARRFPVRIVQRGIRAQEPERQVRREGRGWRLQDQVRAARRQQQSQPAVDELRLKSLSVVNLLIVPKHFFAREIIEERKPLAATARRAGWVGSNIILSRVPESGKIHIVEGGVIRPKDAVLEEWQKTLFLRSESPETRGWLLNVMKCVESLGKRDFTLDEVYAFERHLGDLYPGNQNVKPKIRQQLQYLRDRGFIDFVSRGHYRLRS